VFGDARACIDAGMTIDACAAMQKAGILAQWHCAFVCIGTVHVA
jgi:hypothetical protein